MPLRHAIPLTVEGDLRFASHHDLMRVIERTASRANLPLRYTQGFNPRPKLSLVCPRPVGITTRDDLLVLSLDSPIEIDDLTARLNDCAPKGMRFARARKLEGSHSPRPLTARYELTVRSEMVPPLQERIAELLHMQRWDVERVVRSRRAKTTTAKTIDLRGLVADLNLTGGRLCMTLVPQGDRWARPAEVLQLVALDPRADLARMVRTEVEYEMEQAADNDQ